jgi:hypothetical protein
MRFLILLRRKESLGVAWSRYNQLALSGPEFSIPDAMFSHPEILISECEPFSHKKLKISKRIHSF